MSNPIKCSAVDQPTGIGGIYLKNFFIGMRSDLAFGPSATTGYYNCCQIGENNYLVLVFKTTSGPSNYLPADDTQLIELAKVIGGTSINNADDALYYLAITNSQTIVLNKDYENYPSGISLCYDFSFTSSYPRKGNVAKDLSTENGTARYDGDFVDGPPTFTSSSDGGFINFSSTPIKFSTITPGNALNRTFIAIVKYSTPDSNYGSIISNSDINAATTAYGVRNDNITFQYKDGGWIEIKGSTTLSSNTWYHLAWKQNDSSEMELYVNGVLDNSPTAFATSNGGPVDFIGKNFNGDSFGGSMSKIFYYKDSMDEDRLLDHYYMGNIFRNLSASITPERFFDVANPVCNVQNGNLTSLSGTGTLTGNPSITPRSSFGGTLQLTTTSSVTSVNVDATGSYTLSFWMRYSGTPSAGQLLIIDSAGEFKASITAGAKISFSIVDGSSNTATITSTTSVADGSWHHIVLSYTNTGQTGAYPLDRGMYLYVNGVLETSNNLSGISASSFSINHDLIMSGHDLLLGPIITYKDFAFRGPEAVKNYLASLFRFNA